MKRPARSVGAVRHQRPVQKLCSRVVAEGVVVEDVQHRKIADGQDQATPIDAAGKLIGIGLQFFETAAEIPGLARKQPRPVESGARAGSAGDLSVRESSESGQPGKGHALRDLGVEIELASPPSPGAQGCGRGERVALLAIGGEAMKAGVRCSEGVLALPDIGRLELGACFLRDILRVSDFGKREDARHENARMNAVPPHRAHASRSLPKQQ